MNLEYHVAKSDDVLSDWCFQKTQEQVWRNIYKPNLGQFKHQNKEWQ